MYVLQHPESQIIIGVRFEGNCDEDAIPYLVPFDPNDRETFLLAKGEDVIQSLYDLIHIHYENKTSEQLVGLWIGDFVCDIDHIKEFKIVGIHESL